MKRIIFASILVVVLIVCIFVPQCQVQADAEAVVEQKPQAEDVRKHLEVMQEFKTKLREREERLKKRNASSIYNTKGPIKQTQATALFSIDQLDKKIRKTFEPENYADLVDDIVAMEKRHFYTHYPFYHAQNGGYRILQDLYKKLYEFFSISGELKNFTFLRFQGSAFDKYHTISEFLKDELKQHGIINDNLSDTRTFLLSVNLSPFGNPSIAGEATWNYFVNAISWVRPDMNMVESILKGFDCSTEFSDEIIELADMIKTKEGSLLQIFIPKNKVNQHVYLSWRQGVPHDAQLLRELFTTTHIPMTVINDTLGNYQENWVAKTAPNETIRALFEQAIDRINSGEVKISDILEQYTRDPQSLQGIEHLQARILLSNDLLLNPDSGVIVYRYTTIPPQTMAEYEQKLNALIKKIIDRWVDDHIINKQDVENKTRAEKLFKLIDQQTGIATNASKTLSKPSLSSPQTEPLQSMRLPTVAQAA